MYHSLYNLLTLPLSIALYPVFALHKRGSVNLKERYGFWSFIPPEDELVWFHGASLGEINGLLPVIRLTKERNPGCRVLVTSTSPTGTAHAAGAADYTALLPFDHPIWIKRALSGLKIKKFIFTETELWPSLINILSARGVPLFLINARISDFSWPRYRLFKSFFGRLFKKLRAIAAINAKEKNRFIELGAPAEIVSVAGYSKYDLAPAVKDAEEGRNLKKRFFTEDLPVLVLGSIRPGEEEVWFPALVSAFKKGARINVVVAPRHEEKFGFFAEKLSEAGIDFVKWSERRSGSAGAGANTCLLDTTGDLNAVYSFADLAFIGATLRDLGGHNPLEAAAYNVCITTGPHVKNIHDVTEDLIAEKGLVPVHNREEAEKLIEKLAADPEWFRERGKNAGKVWQKHFGASERIMEVIGA